MADPIKMLRKRQGKRSLRALAREIGCAAPYLSDVYRGRRTPGPKILAFLGLTKVALSVKIRYVASAEASRRDSV